LAERIICDKRGQVDIETGQQRWELAPGHQPVAVDASGQRAPIASRVQVTDQVELHLRIMPKQVLKGGFNHFKVTVMGRRPAGIADHHFALLKRATVISCLRQL
jgi:hypothetical protein